MDTSSSDDNDDDDKVDKQDVTGDTTPEDTIHSNDAARKSETEAPKTPSSSPPLPPLGKLFSLARPEAKVIIFAFIIMILAEASGLINPILLANAYNYLINPALSTAQRMTKINKVMWEVLAIHGTGVVLSFLRSSILSAAGERIVARLRNQLYAAILKQEIAFFDEHKTGELVSRLGSDTTLLQQATSQALPEVCLGLIKLVVAIALMFWISAPLAGVTLGFVIIIFIVCLPIGRWIGTLSKQYQDVLGQAQTHSTEALGAMRTVQSFASEERERVRYRYYIGEPDKYAWWYATDHKTHKTTYGVGFVRAIVSSGFFNIVFGVGFGSLYVSLWYGFKLVNDGELSLGDLTAFQSYVFQIGASLGQTSRFITQFLEGRGASGRIFYLLERVPQIPSKRIGDETGDVESPVRLRPDNMVGAVDFNNMSFSYPSRPDVPVLTDFSLSLAPNTTTALVGSSGAGKSTVVALLQRFYDVTSGSIMIDGCDIRDLDLQWLRSKIGYVQQEPQLFGLTIRENICYGVDRDVPQDELEAVCKKANAHDFIMKWSQGYETLVGERGVKLSGGQKQRIAIARALMVDPRILLLDEATSALDAESEHLVQDAIDKAVEGRTVLIVAHRLSTIKGAGQIVVVDNHRIVDVGSHDILMGRCAKYQDLIKRQSVEASK